MRIRNPDKSQRKACNWDQGTRSPKYSEWDEHLVSFVRPLSTHVDRMSAEQTQDRHSESPLSPAESWQPALETPGLMGGHAAPFLLVQAGQGRGLRDAPGREAGG